jgi:23S rRNA (uracil1939-C5)-methyltransferase
VKAQLRIESIVHGGEGLARHDGRVVFVRGGAPGDVVEAEISGDGRFEHARALRVVEPGPVRVEAPCAIVDRCGGCPLQRVRYADQLAAKEALAADALLRIGEFPRGSYELLPIVPSSKELRYRRRASLHRGPGRTWGFAGDDGVVPVLECALFEEPLQRLADELRGKDFPGVQDLGIDTSAAGQGAIDLRGAPTPALRKRAQALVDAGTVKGVTIAGEVFGDPVLIDPLPGGGKLRSRPDVFSQANRSMIAALQHAALDALGQAAEGSVLELFCGSGTLTLPLLARARSVVGVESAGPAVQLLRRSADELRGAPLRLVTGDAARIAGLKWSGDTIGMVSPGPERRSCEPFDSALIDPPRTGAADAVRALARRRIPRIAYVSCDAPTLARDAKALASAGYRLLRVQPLDLFPQTAHFETVAAFALT